MEHLVFTGNPGVGKSTLLNSLVGSVRFKSGVSAGAGLTVQLQREVKDQREYVDTPGLFDALRIEKAAEEISKSLKLGGLYKVIFVVQLKAGRVKSEDVTTMILILKAAPIQQFGIIINDVPSNTAKKIRDNKDNFGDNVKVALLSELPVKTSHILVMDRIEDCVDENDVLMDPPAHLTDFLQSVPTIEISSEKVEQITVSQYHKLQEQLGASLREMEESETRREKMREDLVKQMQEEKDRRERLEERMRDREAEERKERQELQRQHEQDQAWMRRKWEAEQEARMTLEKQQREQERRLTDEARERAAQAQQLRKIQKQQQIAEHKSEVNGMTCVQLRSELRNKRKATTGNKPDLVGRVLKARGI